MDHSLVQQIAEMWKLAAPPVRPSQATVKAFRAALPKGSDWRGLVQGATPELIDLMVSHKAQRVVSMDLHVETMKAMRLLGVQDWEGVETMVGNWTEDRPDLHSAFDIVFCDGGPLFLPFPEGWRQMYETTYRQLAPRGRTVFRTWADSPVGPDFEEYYCQAIVRFEERRVGMDEEGQTALFVRLVSEVKSAALLGAIDEAGTIAEGRMWPAWQHLETDLRDRYGQGPLEPVVWALFERTNPVGEEGAHLVAAPGEDLIRPLLEEIGYRVDVEVLDEPGMPGRNLMVAAQKA